MRGKEEREPIVQSERGITPARAGKSCLILWPFDAGWDHPRACGEKQEFAFALGTVAGSPPRVRGKAPPPGSFAIEVGITPARAGKRLKRIPYLLRSCAKHLFTPQFCVDDLCQLAVGHSAVSLNIR